MPRRIGKDIQQTGTRHLKVVIHETSVEVIDIASGETLANVDEVQTDLAIEVATSRHFTTVKIILKDIPVEYEEKVIEGSVAQIIEDERRLLR